MDSLTFRISVALMARRIGNDVSAKLGATRYLIETLQSYMSTYILPRSTSRLLMRAGQNIDQLDSVNPITLQRAATSARDDLNQYFTSTISNGAPDIEVFMLALAMNGLFRAPSSMRDKAQQMISEMLSGVWAAIDESYPFGFRNGRFETEHALDMMVGIYACAQIVSGLSFC